MSKLRLASALAAVALATVACGSNSPSESSSDAEKVVLRLNFTVDGSAAPFYLAKQLGLYEDAGLEVDIQPGKGSLVTAQTVGGGQDQFGYITSDAAIRAASEGGDVVLVASLQRSTPMNVVHHPDTTIESVEDLKKVRLVTTANFPQGSTLVALAEREGLAKDDLKFVNIDPGAYAGFYQSNKDAAVLGRPGLQDWAFGKMDGAKAITYRDLGLEMYGNSIATSTKYADANPDTVKSFVEATVEAWEKSVADPDAAVDALLKAVPDAGDAEAIKAQLMGSIETIPGMGDDSTEIMPFEEDRLDEQIEFLSKYLKMTKVGSASDYVDTSFQE